MSTPLPTAGSEWSKSKAPPTTQQQQQHPPHPHVMAGPSPYLNVPDTQHAPGGPSKHTTVMSAQHQQCQRTSPSTQQQPIHQHTPESESRAGPSNEEQAYPEEPARLITQRPPSRPDAISMSPHEIHTLSRRVTSKVHRINLAHMWDNVRDVDRRGKIDQQLYDNLIAFFFGFVPMVLHTRPRDPCAVTPSELLTYRELMRRFERERLYTERTPRGPHRRHEWYSRPGEQGFLAKLWK